MQHKTFEQFCDENGIAEHNALIAARLAWDYQIALADPMATALIKIGQVFGGTLPTEAGEALVNWRGSIEPKCPACQDSGIVFSETTKEPELCGCKHVIESKVYSSGAPEPGAAGAESLGEGTRTAPPTTAES